MLKKMILLILTICFNNEINAQLSFHENQLFDSLLISGEYSKVKQTKKFQTIRKRETYFNLINTACVYSLLNEVDSAVHYIWLALGKSKLGSDILVDEELENVKRSVYWKQIYDTIINRHTSSYNLNALLSHKIYIIGRENNYYRNSYFRTKDIFGDSSQYTKRAKQKSDESDLKCEKYLAQLIDSLNKFPGFQIIDEKSAHALILIFQHSDCDFKMMYYPYISVAFFEKNISNHDFALATDRILTNCFNKTQLYGTQLIKNNEGKLVLQGTCDTIKINQNRLKIGLNEIK